MHVDDFTYNPSSDAYASFVLCLFRLPALARAKWRPFTQQFKLFCTCRGKAYRVTGASRLGDVWLASDPNTECGYDERVDVDECSEWRATWQREKGGE